MSDWLEVVKERMKIPQNLQERQSRATSHFLEACYLPFNIGWENQGFSAIVRDKVVLPTVIEVCCSSVICYQSHFCSPLVDDVSSITDWLEKSRTKNVRFYFFYYGSRQNVAHTILEPEYTIGVGRKRTNNHTYALLKAFYTHEITCM